MRWATRSPRLIMRRTVRLLMPSKSATFEMDNSFGTEASCASVSEWSMVLIPDLVPGCPPMASPVPTLVGSRGAEDARREPPPSDRGTVGR